MELSLPSVSWLIGIVFGLVIAVKVFGSKGKKSKQGSRNGVVVLHQFLRSLHILAPACLKLETYLRMAKIPYECDCSFNMSSKGKVPWIEYNGQEKADSNFCIEFLNKEFGVDVDSHLTVAQKGIATAILVMLEENTYWSLVYYRFLGDHATRFRDVICSVISLPIGYIRFWMLQRRYGGYLYGHGIGRHSAEEIYGIAERDLRAVSTCLGVKKFLFGDKPCIADAALFALVHNFIYPEPDCPQGKLILSQLKNLEDHSKRFKEMFYPDWDELTSGKVKSD